MLHVTFTLMRVLRACLFSVRDVCYLKCMYIPYVFYVTIQVIY